jgi:hypothetical protein
MGLIDRWTGKQSRQPEDAIAVPDPGAENLEPRVRAFLADFEQGRFGLTPTGSVDYPTCRDAVLELHADAVDEASRVALLRFYAALIGTGVEGLLRQGRDSSELERLWRSDYFSMLAKEVIDTNGDVDAATLDHVNRREQSAGRLGPEEAFQVQRSQPAETPQPGVRAPREVGQRAIALWTIVLASIAPAQREKVTAAFAAEGQREWLAEPELRFLRNPEPDARDVIAFGWQAERLALLLWGMGLAELPGHAEKCDPLRAAALLPPTAPVSFEDFLSGVELRPFDEIHAVASDLDTSYWAAHQAREKGLPAPEGVNLDILDERLRAAAWLIGQEVPEWPSR